MRTGHYLDPSQLFLSIPLAIGGLLWIITYILIIRRSFKDLAPGLPLFAICLNVTWESLAVISCTAPGDPTGLCPKPDNGTYLLHFMETAGVLTDFFWLGLDVIIVYQLFKFGRSFEPAKYIRAHWYTLLGCVLVIFFALHYGFVTYYDDTFMIVDGWIINMVMSLAFILLLFQREEHALRGLSWPAAWTKMFANLFYAGGLTLIYVRDAASHVFESEETRLFMYIMFAATFLFDATYVWHLKRARQATPDPHNLSAALS